MKTILFSCDSNLIDEWIQKHNLKDCLSSYSLEMLEEIIYNFEKNVLICDYDTVAHDLNILLSENKLPKNCIVLEKSPAIITGKKLIYKGIRAYGNSRMLKQHFSQMLETVKDGNIWTYPELTSALVKSSDMTNLNDDAKKLIDSRLTSKEKEVLYLVIDGLSNNAISKKLKITTRTVKSHITSLFNKLHVNDRVSLILLLK